MSLALKDFPSSAAFDAIQASLEASPSERAEAIESAKGIFAFTLKQGKKAESWYIDLKENGVVGRGLAPEGKKPAVTLILNDSDFSDLVAGKAQAQSLYMKGKLKTKGDMMKAMKLEPILKKARGPQSKL